MRIDSRGESVRKDTAGESYSFNRAGLKLDDVSFNCINYAILEPITDNQKTKGGIYIPTEMFNQARHEHANILMRVIKPPTQLVSAKNINHKQKHDTFKLLRLMPWDTEIEIEEGDLVVVKPKSVYNCDIYTDDKRKYYKIHYEDIILAFKKASELKFGKRKRKIRQIDDINYFDKPVLLNGYVVCEEITDRPRSEIIIDPFVKVKYEYGKVLFYGAKNKRYFNSWKDNKNLPRANELLKRRHNVSDEGIDIKLGDVIIKRRSDIHISLQSSMHKIIETDKELFVTQRCDIDGILES